MFVVVCSFCGVLSGGVVGSPVTFSLLVALIWRCLCKVDDTANDGCDEDGCDGVGLCYCHHDAQQYANDVGQDDCASCH